MLVLWLCAALASDPVPEPPVQGFDRLHLDPDTMHVEPTRRATPAARGTLTIDNGHTARATVKIGDVSVGELLPRATGVLREVTAGTYTVSFHLPHGVVRTEQLDAR